MCDGGEVLKPLQEEMRMSESIFLPNGVAINVSFNLVSFNIKTFMSFYKWSEEKSWGVSLFYTVVCKRHQQRWQKQIIYGKTLYLPPYRTRLLYILLHHSIAPSTVCVIYLWVCSRIDFLLYSRPLKPGGRFTLPGSWLKWKAKRAH